MKKILIRKQECGHFSMFVTIEINEDTFVVQELSHCDFGETLVYLNDPLFAKVMRVISE